ncbi:MAG: phosphodiester glycosidase family protein, partial [Bacteroidota bacterium]
DYLIKKKGINPANVMEIGTAVDTSVYFNIYKRKKINAFLQLEKILSRYKDQLIVYSVEDVINSNLVDTGNSMPILIGNKTRPIDKFIAEDIIFLQPTRIISRKRIEIGFRLLMKILENEGFYERMKKTKNLKITILVTGPIAAGHYDYFTRLVNRFQRLLESMEEELRDKIYLAFLFSELDKESFKKCFESPVGIPELYNIASLVLLPSKTEGRGLPIIESTACGTPIFVRKYTPKNVYEEVIGYHLEEKNRLKVIEYDGKNIKRKYADAIIDRVLFPHKYTEEVNHNRKAVIRRFSLEALNDNLEEILLRLAFQLRSGKKENARLINSLNEYRNSFNFEDENLKAILNTKNRQYIAGHGKLLFMIYLKSLIDPSYFRIEQMEFKGRIFHLALEIIRKDPEEMHIPIVKKLQFLNTIEELLNYREERDRKIRHDHSMPYRHRNNYFYPYQDYTMQELSGLINLFYFKIIEPTIITQVKETPHFFTDWDLALLQLTGSTYLSIDNRKELIKKLQKNIPIAYFPGEHLMHELELFILQPVRSRLRMGIEEVLTEEYLLSKIDKLAKIYVFTQEKNVGNQLNLEETKEYILSGKNSELKLLYNHAVLQLVPTEQWTVGIHIYQLGSKALEKLKIIKQEDGFLITNRRNAILMTDILDLDRFHIGKARTELDANMLGIPIDSGYIQFAPAGIRTVLSYPVPVQTAREFDKVIHSKLFKDLKEKKGEKKLFALLKKDAEENGSPAQFVLDQLHEKEKANVQKPVTYRFISGTYEDSLPYNGVMASLNYQCKKWEFLVATNKDRPIEVTSFVKKHEKKLERSIPVAWNGGYILNPELVGKLGINESYIGSPLGLIISEGKILSLPLFNKAALLVYKNGGLDIKRLSLKNGFKLIAGNKTFLLDQRAYNLINPAGDLCFYDLLFDEQYIINKSRIIVRLAGNTVKEVIRGSENSKLEILPAGLTLSFSEDAFPEDIKIGTEIELYAEEFINIKHAIEAGPMLLDNGKNCLDMKVEGWKHPNSIRTQAARIDYTDMRGPKIAAGIDDKGNLIILAINGRIRESVGATHDNMAEILKSKGIIKAMGFDPGGSSTLVVEGKARNISPYNHKYEENVYALPPEPRAVSSAIMAYIREE